MKNFIAELCAGAFYTSTIPQDENTEERDRLSDLCDTLYKKLVENFTNEEKKLLEELQLNDAELWSNEIDRAFSRGVKIGMQLQKALDKIKL